MKKIFFALFLPISFCLNLVWAQAKDLIPGGEAIGVVLHYDGILVTGTYTFESAEKTIDPLVQDIQPGDLIVKCENESVTSNEALVALLADHIPATNTLNLTLIRDGTELERQLQVAYDASSQSFKTGLYIQDNLSGIGTITYYDPENKTYGALGHQMIDEQSGQTMSPESGTAFEAYIVNVEPSRDGNPGKKIGRIEKTAHLGDVALNNQFGIYGHYTSLIKQDATTLPTASRDEIHLGTAEIWTVLDGKKVEAFQIELTELKKQDEQEVKSLTFKVTDERLLEATNGIIQGMSGSPIIQDGKIVGAVTHVSTNHVDMGYGLYIDWMLEESGQMIE